METTIGAVDSRNLVRKALMGPLQALIARVLHYVDEPSKEDPVFQ